MILKLFIGKEGDYRQLDLYGNETIDFNSSIANTDDITKINTDFTKSFTVPASDKNNNIFKHFYNADIYNSFDARIKVSGYITMDGFLFRFGKFRLEKVQVKHKKASSYTINFWGAFVNLSDIISDDTLNSLDLDYLNFDYSYDNVKALLTANDKLISNFISPKRQFEWGGGANTDKLVDVQYVAGQNRGIRWDEIKPSIQLNELILAIEQKYNLSFSRQFFDRPEFMNLYMWMQRGKDGKVGGGRRKIDFQTWYSGSDIPERGYWNMDTDTLSVAYWTDNNNDFRRTNVLLTVTPQNLNAKYSVEIMSNGVLFGKLTDITGVGVWDFNFKDGVNTQTIKENLTFYVISTEFMPYTASLHWDTRTRYSALGDIYTYNYEVEAPLQSIPSTFDAKLHVPNLKIKDFLKGIFQMFKLVAIQQDNGTIYINKIEDFYSEGDIVDLSKYINYESYDVSRGIIHSVLDFRYQEPTTILNKQFKINEGIAYGDSLTTLKDEDGTILDGSKLEMKLPFEQILFERLANSTFYYGLSVDEKIEPVTPKPVIFYNVKHDNGEVSLLDANGNTTLVSGEINTPSVCYPLDTPLYSINWDTELNPYTLAIINETLFSQNWIDYVELIFNIRKRQFKFSGYLPVNILTTLRLNDLIKIKNDFYRINDYSVNLTTRQSTLNLINSFTNNINMYQPSVKKITFEQSGGVVPIYITNAKYTQSIDLIPTDDGTSWIVATAESVTCEENTTGEPRDLYVQYTNNTGSEFQIYIYQK